MYGMVELLVCKGQTCPGGQLFCHLTCCVYAHHVRFLGHYTASFGDSDLALLQDIFDVLPAVKWCVGEAQGEPIIPPTPGMYCVVSCDLPQTHVFPHRVLIYW